MRDGAMMCRPNFESIAMLNFIRPLIINALRDERREWTAQGFGFLRTYFGPPEQPKRFRLNLWDSTFTVPNVSTIHDHPWDFQSLIVAGGFGNKRYKIHSTTNRPSHSYTVIRTGVGGGVEKDATLSCDLEPYSTEHYKPGDTYSQQANEIHETYFADGAVTLNERVGDTERARVFWPYGTDWVDAIPRSATREEIETAVSHSLRKWF